MALSSGRVQPARPGDPTRVGPYRIVGRLGSGGMGTVHAGLDAAGARVAVKVVNASYAEDAEFRARFRREVQLSARVQGPWLIPLLAADPDAEAPWLATAYVPGPTLDQHLAAHGPLTGSTLYAFAVGTAQALAAVHAAGVVHRDVKPQNVILNPAGPRVLDFGIAHATDGTSVTRTGVMTGTPGWISPEHYRTGTVGPAGDMFAWGTLVAYAATSRLPFGTGAPDAVAYRVMSAAPDLGGLPGELRGTVEEALAKSPEERITADAAAQQCARLLSAQATQILAADTGPAPTTVGTVVAAWQVPAAEDPAWRVPPAPARRRALTVLVAAAVIGAVVGGAAALDTDSRAGTGAASKGADTAPPRPSGKPAPHSASAVPRGGGSTPPEDPRSIRIPTDPLAGIPRPAYTRADDDSQPAPEEWRASTRAGTPQEQDTEQAISRHMASMLATKNLDFMEPTVTFNLRAQTVIVTGGPVPQLPDNYQDVFRRAGEMAACAALAHRLRETPTTWPYGRFSIHWKLSDGDVEAPAIGFGRSTDGCFSEIAGQWHADELGMATAQIPSSDRAEIRVADAAVKAVTATWNAGAAEINEVPMSARDGISLGFDPVENAAYVWTGDPDNRFGNRAAQSNLAGAVEKAVCDRLMAEFADNRSWRYTRWTLAVLDPTAGEGQFIRSGTCTP
ncbi:protein kinase [Streptomyces cyaneofuscatus]|uniref:serine/threonine-protein kinase n=1 Tax=Streptomyces cyaneofuscatus TaxID=66883 RepID=UPI002E15D9B5|nr:protein kinase [Streptomyces cyaneofuscatus]WSI52086.1 protein kinase [Streptomyces cyaneofuscatus]